MENRPRIIKKIRKGRHSAGHGGSWKVAYADFVTAMMAFFLLMWLLGSSTKANLAGISDYFQTPLKVALSGGVGSGAATSILSGGGKNIAETVGEPKKGADKTWELNKAKKELERQERNRLKSLQAELSQKIEASDLKDLKDQVRMDITAEGLRIQLVDSQNRPMFETGSTRMRPYTKDLLRQVAEVLQPLPNKLSLTGHTDATPYAGRATTYSNWELSTERANEARRVLAETTLGGDRIIRVTGLSDQVPLVKDSPQDPSNRRISVVVLNKRTQSAILDGADNEDTRP